MESSQSRLRAIAKLCDARGPEDGVDPRHISRGSSRKKTHKKTSQLCKQAQVTMQMVLSASEDLALRGLTVVDVEPAASKGNLLVVLKQGEQEEELTETEVLEALARATGVLRGAVAEAIHRKRVPNLAYAFIPWEGWKRER